MPITQRNDTVAWDTMPQHKRGENAIKKVLRVLVIALALLAVLVVPVLAKGPKGASPGRPKGEPRGRPEGVSNGPPQWASAGSPEGASNGRPECAKGGRAKGSDIWVYQDEDPDTLVKSIYHQTSSGIIHQWRYDPEHLHLMFKPADRFRQPDEGNYFDWMYTESRYTETDTNPGELLDYYVDGADYWVKINSQ